MTKPLTYHYIPRWEGGKNGNAVLFLPDQDANTGRMVCYAHIGQHSEAQIEYYHGTKPATICNREQREEIAALVKEYEGFLKPGETLRKVLRDSAKFREERYGRVNK